MAPAAIQVKVLGSGTSMGVPSLGCHCRVCTSRDPKDNRLRPSLLLSRNGRNVVIDTTPDFRQQALRVGLERLDAILFTHGHADHILGFDDVRPFNIRQKAAIPVYGTEETFEVLRRAFPYAFDGRPSLSTTPSVTLQVIRGPLEIAGIPFVPVPLLHGDMGVLGFRFGPGAYLTDFSAVPDSSLVLLEGLHDLVLDALRDVPHPMHQTVEQALALIERLKPRRAWFTHIAHDLSHAETNERLRRLGRAHVQLAYDGLEIEVPIDAHEGALPRAIVPQESVPAKSVLTLETAEAWADHYGPSGRGSVLAIGNFDGVHLGHQAILRAAVARARESGAVATVLTFDPPPLKVLRPESAPPRLSTTAQRLGWFGMCGLEAAVVVAFTWELARLSPEEFVSQIVVRGLQARAVFVGENFRFGYQQSGNATVLRDLGSGRGFEVQTIPPIICDGEVVSSTAIRREIAAGRVTRAARLLGRPFALTGPIIRGTGTGHRFTFPTLNLVPEQELLPARGVYITRTSLEGQTRSHRSVTNIGVRPTFHGSALSVETHLLDHSVEHAPERVEITLWKRLREEAKFNSAEELRAQIARDVAAANRFFSRLRRFRSVRQLV